MTPTKYAAAVLVWSALLAAAHVAGPGAQAASYFYTVTAGIASAFGAFWAMTEARRAEAWQIEGLFAHLCLISSTFLAEEFGWWMWRLGYRPELFEYTLGNVLKLTTATGMVSLLMFIGAFRAGLTERQCWATVRTLWWVALPTGAVLLMLASTMGGA